MEKAYKFILILLFFNLKSFSQNIPEEFNIVQKFIESTVQIPFMAQVADVQGTVSVQVTNGINGLPMRYEIVKSLRFDCDNEALRVVKLINAKHLNSLFKDKKVILLEVPFQNKEKINLENGYIVKYFDANRKLIKKSNEIKFSMKYLVDTVLGSYKSQPEYFEFKNNRSKRIGYTVSKVDSTQRNIPTIYENNTDTLKILKFLSVNNSGFPTITFESYENGQNYKKEISEKTFYYFPNGRIKTVLEEIEVDSEKVVTETNWYANGQILAISTFVKAQPNDAHKYISVWDTLGNKVVNNGEGVAEFYSIDGVENGSFKSGFKDGNWVKKLINDTIAYKESYDLGNLLKGIRYVGKDSIEYVATDIRANFTDGMRWFFKHLQINLIYPFDAIKSGAEGTVLVEFTVCTDGSLCDYAIRQSVTKSLNEEALRVLKLTSGKWKSAKNRGLPISSKLTLPIKFQNLGIINR